MIDTRDSKRTFLLTCEVRPNSTLEERDGIGGAFVNCWILGKGLDEVREQATRHLEGTGWTIVAVTGERVVTRESIPEDSREYYDQAQVDGDVYVIHVFPPEPPDA